MHSLFKPLAVIVMTVFLAGCSPSQSKVNMSKVTVEDLAAAYGSDEVAANDAYQGERVEVTGTISNLGTLRENEARGLVTMPTRGLTVVLFGEEILQLPDRAYITASCTGDGVRQYSTEMGLLLRAVTLKDCTLVRAETYEQGLAKVTGSWIGLPPLSGKLCTDPKWDHTGCPAPAPASPPASPMCPDGSNGGSGGCVTK